jgi:hypothetical protein
VQVKSMLGGLGGMSPQALQEAMKDPKIQDMMKKAMSDPEFVKKMQAMQEAMKDPAVQQQMQAMQQFQSNEALKKKMEELKDDPELKDMFEDIKKNGMGAFQKYYNDPKVLAKIGSRIQDVVPAQSAAPQAAPEDQAPPEINTLIDAAKYGDIEAVEDFIAIGKDVNTKDEELRSPLHFAAGTGNTEIARILIESGAELECRDSKGNTPLHYAAGYGRPDVTRVLCDCGCDRSAKNGTGKTPADLVAAAPKNPINADPALCQKLRP